MTHTTEVQIPGVPEHSGRRRTCMSASSADTRTAPAGAALSADRRAGASAAAAPSSLGRQRSARSRSTKVWYVSRSLPPGASAFCDARGARLRAPGVQRRVCTGLRLSARLQKPLVTKLGRVEVAETTDGGSPLALPSSRCERWHRAQTHAPQQQARTASCEALKMSSSVGALFSAAAAALSSAESCSAEARGTLGAPC